MLVISEFIFRRGYKVIMTGGPTRDRDIESSGETLVYELASESNESFIQSSDTILPATSAESAMIQMSEPNKELESGTMCDSENQVQGVHLRESFIDLDPGKWLEKNQEMPNSFTKERPFIETYRKFRSARVVVMAISSRMEDLVARNLFSDRSTWGSDFYNISNYGSNYRLSLIFFRLKARDVSAIHLLED
ncbi:hypothetical protein TNCT_322561 [Trichonephila clavata]|uniref:Uncharacterized protein n=1 Tax=Trichonephila clavata TaxID=2740835 RepID=A0A8X6HL50_TRICU|nr:hypothetical protein TNCT_322561 [Trichonephila clavata]